VLPAEPALTDLLQRSARLYARHRAALGKRPLVLPNGEFFPDRFTRDRASTERLLERMQEHAGLLDIPVDLRLISGDEEPQAGHGCSSSTCDTPSLSAPDQRLIPHSDGWLLQLSPAELGHPVALTCVLARSLASIFLIENAGQPQHIESPFEVSVDLAASALGFGVLLLEGSHIYAKSCGGPSIAKVTALGPAELAVACAIFAHVYDQRPKPALAELSTTQKVALGEALHWAKVQRRLLERLKRDPAALLSEPITFAQERSFLGGLFGKSPSARTTDEDLERALAGELDASELHPTEVAARPAKARPPGHDDLRALVDEAFNTGAK
jgi:hypothetical protein